MKNIEKFESLFSFFNIEKGDLRNFLDSHPSLYSLLSITDTLNYFQIPNFALNFSTEEIKNIESPCFINIVKEKGEEGFWLLKSIKNGKADCFDPQLGNVQLPVDDLLKFCIGPVILVDHDYIKEPSKIKNSLLDTASVNNVLVLFSIILFSFLAFDIIRTRTLYEQIWFITTLIGMFGSFLLLQIEYGSQSKLAVSLCSFNQNFDCNSVSSNPKTKLLKNINYSEIGFIYFLSQIVWFTLIAVFKTSNLTLSIFFPFSSLSIIFIVYSLYAQLVIIKKWCLLCLIVLFSLFCQLIITLKMSSNENYFNISFIKYIFILVSVTLFFAYTITQLRSKKKKQEQIKELMKLKLNTSIFTSFLNKVPKTNIDILENDIIIGNRTTKHQLTLILNPFCEHCFESLKIAKYHAKVFEDELNVCIKLIGNTADHVKVGAILTSFNNNTAQLDKLDEWFSKKDSSFIEKYYDEKTVLEFGDTIVSNSQWAKSIQIKGTPTVYLDGKEIAEPYKIVDLNIFLPRIITIN